MDDPSALLHRWRQQEPGEAIAAPRQLGSDLGFDFDALLAAASAAERERLARIESGLTKPAAKAAPPV